MAFFDNQDHAGLALLIMAIVSILMGIVSIIWEIIDGDEIIIANIIFALGTLVGGFLYLAFAQRVRGNTGSNKFSDKFGVSGGALTDKFDIIVEFVHVFAMATLVTGIFKIIGGIVEFIQDTGVEGGAVSLIISGVVYIIIAFIVMWLYRKITDGKDSLVDKIVWIILLIVFLLYIIFGLLACLSIIGIPLGICAIIIGVFMFMGLLDNDVKSKFGM